MSSQTLTPEALKARRESNRKSRREARRRHRAREGQFRVNHIVDPRPSTADVAARLAEVPDDTRTVTERFFGDPLPGRSALAHR